MSLEDKIADAREQKGDLRDELDRAKATHRPQGKRAAIKAKRKSLRDRINQIEARIEKLRAKRKARRQGRSSKPTVVYTRISPNKSSRGGVAPSLIVLHSTESDNIPGSIQDLVNLTNYFALSSAQASSHVLTDSDGHSARCVPDGDKAWTQAYYNPWCLSIEQIGRAASERWTDAHVAETARWIARWSKKYGIPIQRGSVSDGTIVRPGVVTHKDLSILGGGHVDPGANFPFDRCLELAKKFK